MAAVLWNNDPSVAKGLSPNINEIIALCSRNRGYLALN